MLRFVLYQVTQTTKTPNFSFFDTNLNDSILYEKFKFDLSRFYLTRNHQYCKRKFLDGNIYLNQI